MPFAYARTCYTFFFLFTIFCLCYINIGAAVYTNMEYKKKLEHTQIISPPNYNNIMLYACMCYTYMYYVYVTNMLFCCAKGNSF